MLGHHRKFYFSPFLKLKRIYFCKKVIFVMTISVKRQSMEELAFIVDAFILNNSLRLMWHWMEKGPDNLTAFVLLMFLGRYHKDLGNCEIFVRAVLPSVTTTMVQVYWNQDFVLASHPKVGHIYPQGTFFLYFMCSNECHRAENFSIFHYLFCMLFFFE